MEHRRFISSDIFYPGSFGFVYLFAGRNSIDYALFINFKVVKKAKEGRSDKRCPGLGHILDNVHFSSLWKIYCGAVVTSFINKKETE